jgi:hypothetical protein
MYVCDLWSVMAGNGQSGCLHKARAGGGSDKDKEKMTCHRLSARLLLLKKSLWMLTGAVTVVVTTTFSLDDTPHPHRRQDISHEIHSRSLWGSGTLERLDS